jgi:hypothetical protein
MHTHEHKHTERERERERQTYKADLGVGVEEKCGVRKNIVVVPEEGVEV